MNTALLEMSEKLSHLNFTLYNEVDILHATQGGTMLDYRPLLFKLI